MKKLLIALLVCAAVPFAQGEGPVDEMRVSLRQEMLRLINRDRKQFGLSPVQLNVTVSAIADSYCEQQIRNGTTGHFTLDGQSPYMRYSFAGGNDAVSENAAAWSASYRFSNGELVDMMHGSHTAMMTEVPPHDGHRKTILDPFATHVGIGLAWKDGEFRVAQEFVRHYVDWTRTLPRTARAGERLVCSGKPVDGYSVEAISVHHEPVPMALTASEANHINSYSLPTERRDYLPQLKTLVHRGKDGSVRNIRQTYADGARGDFDLDDQGAFTFAVPTVDGPGIYTVVVWLRKGAEKEAFSATTVSMRVEAATGAASSAMTTR